MSESEFQTNFLDNVMVTTPIGKVTPLKSLWKEKNVVLKILPPSGSSLGSYEAQGLNELHIACDSAKVTFAVICSTDPSLKTFLTDGYWDYDIFLDPESKVYGKVHSYQSTTQHTMKKTMVSHIQAINRYLKRVLSVNIRDRGKPLTLVIGKGGNILFHFKPTKNKMCPSVKEMYECLGGDSNDIDEPEIVPPQKLQLLKSPSFSSIHSTRTSFF
ncbi:hypothetical protein DSO57_1008627 [Entomophthora muscae]|uniref:Uncharacterized protein n=1 Tax=Entomophthora muscae TaxID=34485 RepID=A0ACC2TUK3_9FUNG|nr:hypothetical protein DSO57_1008627 [Entomophthora muscae]